MDWENIPNNIEDYFGFIYEIERINALPGEKRFYWGCKMLHKTVTKPPLKGKKRKRKEIKSSDWKDYYGSSESLKNDLAIHGKNNFKRKILTLCDCKWQLKYEELLVQLQNKVLFRDDVYNGIVNVRIGVVPKELKNHYSKLYSTQEKLL